MVMNHQTSVTCFDLTIFLVAQMCSFGRICIERVDKRLTVQPSTRKRKTNEEMSYKLKMHRDALYAL